jgi:hypothetical protein
VLHLPPLPLCFFCPNLQACYMFFSTTC